jgi:predicted enzyme related to lactoylglutathione lyase
VTQCGEAIASAGGSVRHGPVEVPGPAYIAVAQDPQGAWFAVVGGEK